jgi:hypothetical protein
MSSLSLAICEINAPRPHPIDAETLLRCLRLRRPLDEWRPHVRAFLEEIPVELLHDIVLDRYITIAELERSIAIWGARDCDNVEWIKEMAHLAMARTA